MTSPYLLNSISDRPAAARSRHDGMAPSVVASSVRGPLDASQVWVEPKRCEAASYTYLSLAQLAARALSTRCGLVVHWRPSMVT